MPWSPSAAPLLPAPREGVRAEVSAARGTSRAGWSAAKAADGCAELRAGQARRAAEGRGCRAPLAPALRRRAEKCFLLGVRQRQGFSRGRSPVRTPERGVRAEPQRTRGRDAGFSCVHPSSTRILRHNATLQRSLLRRGSDPTRGSTGGPQKSPELVVLPPANSSQTERFSAAKCQRNQVPQFMSSPGTSWLDTEPCSLTPHPHTHKPPSPIADRGCLVLFGLCFVLGFFKQ